MSDKHGICLPDPPSCKRNTRAKQAQRTVYEATGSSIACDVVSKGEWGWEIVLSRNGHWFFGQGFPTFELAKVEAENLEATCLREGCVLLRPQLGVPPVNAKRSRGRARLGDRRGKSRPGWV